MILTKKYAYLHCVSKNKYIVERIDSTDQYKVLQVLSSSNIESGFRVNQIFSGTIIYSGEIVLQSDTKDDFKKELLLAML